MLFYLLWFCFGVGGAVCTDPVGWLRSTAIIMIAFLELLPLADVQGRSQDFYEGGSKLVPTKTGGLKFLYYVRTRLWRLSSHSADVIGNVHKLRIKVWMLRKNSIACCECLNCTGGRVGILSAAPLSLPSQELNINHMRRKVVLIKLQGCFNVRISVSDGYQLRRKIKGTVSRYCACTKLWFLDRMSRNQKMRGE